MDIVSRRGGHRTAGALPQAAFTRIDSQGSGRIDHQGFAEMLAAVDEGGEALPGAELRAIFEAADEEGVGSLTFAQACH